MCIFKKSLFVKTMMLNSIKKASTRHFGYILRQLAQLFFTYGT